MGCNFWLKFFALHYSLYADRRSSSSYFTFSPLFRDCNRNSKSRVRLLNSKVIHYLTCLHYCHNPDSYVEAIKGDYEFETLSQNDIYFRRLSSQQWKKWREFYPPVK